MSSVLPISLQSFLMDSIKMHTGSMSFCFHVNISRSDYYRTISGDLNLVLKAVLKAAEVAKSSAANDSIHTPALPERSTLTSANTTINNIIII